jgi:predicted kinase
MAIRIPHGALVVLVGPSGSGKSTWAARWFRSDQVVSSDGMRALVGVGEHDQRAGGDAFDVLDLAVERRLARGLVTVVDSLGLDGDRRAGWLAAARRHGRPAQAVVFDVPADECRRRNRNRPRPVPAKVLAGQLRRFEGETALLATEGFDALHEPGPAVVVPAPFAGCNSCKSDHQRIFGNRQRIFNSKK